MVERERIIGIGKQITGLCGSCPGFDRRAVTKWAWSHIQEGLRVRHRGRSDSSSRLGIERNGRMLKEQAC
jgi:hypothetical protein